jgi:hypothetical protein
MCYMFLCKYNLFVTLYSYGGKRKIARHLRSFSNEPEPSIPSNNKSDSAIIDLLSDDKDNN